MPFREQGSLHRLLTLAYSFARWSLIIILISLGLQTAYFAMPPSHLPWKIVSPGSLVMTIGLITGSLVFRFLVNNFSNYQNMYGDLGGLLVLMVWFYFCSLSLLRGAARLHNFWFSEKGRKDPGGRENRTKLEPRTGLTIRTLIYRGLQAARRKGTHLAVREEGLCG